jgi:tripartite-type tricarboxylate transporter receptor subunit TctC
LVREGLQAPDLIEGLAKNALEPSTQSPEEFAAILKRDLAHWGPIVKATGFKAEE